MKKTAIAFVFASVLGLFTACQNRDAVTIVETLSESATLKTNESYTFTLPTTAEDYTITTPASHASVSLIGLDATKTQKVYQYTPTQDFIGTDVVVITSSEIEASSGCGNHSAGDSLIHEGGHPHGPRPHGHHGHHGRKHVDAAEKVLQITITLNVSGDENSKTLGYSQR